SVHTCCVWIGKHRWLTPGIVWPSETPFSLARVGPTTPTRAKRLADASVDPTDARNAPAFGTTRSSRWRDRESSPRTAAIPRSTAVSAEQIAAGTLVRRILQDDVPLPQRLVGPRRPAPSITSVGGRPPPDCGLRPWRQRVGQHHRGRGAEP